MANFLQIALWAITLLVNSQLAVRSDGDAYKRIKTAAKTIAMAGTSC